MRYTKLRDGETPWDSWTREQLVIEVRRMYQALQASHSALRMTSYTGRLAREPFWMPGGTGGDAIAAGETVMAPYKEDSEEIYRAYFRMRSFLLMGYGQEWFICPEGHCWGQIDGREAPTECSLATCKKPLEPLSWNHFEDDIKPEAGR